MDHSITDMETTDQTAPIGLFDSGVGGLSVARHIQRELPAERLLYIADSAYAPYGTKTTAEVEERAVKLSQYLIQRRVKALVVACNTATAAAITRLRSLHSIPIIGMEPAVKPAVSLTRTGVIGVLATAATLNSAKFTRLQAEFGQGVKIITQACPGLVELVEKGDLDGTETRQLAAEYLGKLTSRGADTVVLGCTHYPFLLPLFRQLSGPHIRILDTGLPVAREVQRQLEARKLAASLDNVGNLEILSSGDLDVVRTITSRLWGSPLNVHPLELVDGMH
ncbi:MAG: glutamate racemase [Methylococcaceae bacterium]|nr:glutamate racemase [Methylococcaceae bacterium]